MLRDQSRGSQARGAVRIALHRELERFERGGALAGEDQRFSFQLCRMRGRVAGPRRLQRLGRVREITQAERGATADERAPGIGKAGCRSSGSLVQSPRGQGGARLFGCLLANLRIYREKPGEQGARPRDCHALTKACIRGSGCLHSVGRPSTGAV